MIKAFGHEWDFALTVGAYAEISEFCPDGDLSRMSEIFSGESAQVFKAGAALISALANGAEQQRHFEDVGYVPRKMTPELVLALPPQLYSEMQTAAMAALQTGQETTVNLAPSKKKDGESA